MTQQDEWWRKAVIYQIYPRSFMDSNHDGIGDLAGITSKLSYIADLGVDAIWIAPFFKSPMADFGYDVSDHCSVDPMFGDLDAFTQLRVCAQELGLKVIIDAVMNHTSEQHPWFLESRLDKTNPKHDWYVWANPKADGTAPNNWLSIFGGSAWTWEPKRQQYYMHNFLAQQPDLNYHNPAVREAVLHNIEFWLEMGVDGIRIDAANFLLHDASLQDNPVKSSPTHDNLTVMGIRGDNPYAYQVQVNNHTQPDNLKFIKELRRLLDKYPKVTSLAEISSEDSFGTLAEYTQVKSGLHMAYSFELLNDTYSARYIRNTVEKLESKLNGGWPCWALGNHDVERVVSRWDNNNNNEDKAKMLTALLGSLKGTICVYQGEELGLPQADIAPASLKDPYGKHFWPSFSGRDGCRTPMPWNNSPQAGFTLGTPWLPIPDNHKNLAVQSQLLDQHSVLNAFKAFIKWRNSQTVLLQGEIEFFDTAEPLLLFKRYTADKAIICGFNLSDKSVEVELPHAHVAYPLMGHEFNNTRVTDAHTLQFLPYGVFFAAME